MSKMMTNILEKTIGSVFTGSGSDQFAGLKSLYQKCLAARTKSVNLITEPLCHLLLLLKFILGGDDHNQAAAVHREVSPEQPKH